MGLIAENVAARYGVSREEQDRYARRSQDRAVAARDGRLFDREIVPVTLSDGTLVSRDDGPRSGTTVEKARGAQAGVRGGPIVAAGNACPLDDGAARRS